MSAVPLAVACLAVPVGNALSWLAGPGPAVSPYLPWLLLAALGTAWAILFRRSGERLRKRFFFELSMFVFLAGMVVLRREELLWQLDTAVYVLPELVPAIMLGFCWLWTLTFGLPDRAAFQRWGAALGALCLLDLGVEAAARLTLPVQRVIGDPNILAGLLLVCLCASLKPGRLMGGEYEPDQGSPLLRGLILAGLLATLSRTGLFAAGWVYLFFGRGSRLVRAAFTAACFLLIVATFLVPVTEADLVRYLDYRLWSESLRLFARDPLLFLWGLPLGPALPITLSPEVAALLEVVTGSSALIGVHPQHISSFWVRFLLGWGAVPPLLFMTALFLLLGRRVTRMGAALVAALFAQGMSSPLLYDPNTAAPLGLGLFLALSRPGAQPNLRPSPAPESRNEPETGPEGAPATTPEPTPSEGDDPATTWDMRPL